MAAHLPVSRIRTIIKSSADVDIVGKESTFIITRAAELFIKHLAKEAYKDTKKGKKLDYKNVANVVNNNSKYEFLHEIIPKKITVREYFQLMEKENAEELSSDDSSDEEDSSSSEDEQSDHADNKSNRVSSDSDCVILD